MVIRRMVNRPSREKPSSELKFAYHFFFCGLRRGFQKSKNFLKIFISYPIAIALKVGGYHFDPCPNSNRSPGLAVRDIVPLSSPYDRARYPLPLSPKKFFLGRPWSGRWAVEDEKNPIFLEFFSNFCSDLLTGWRYPRFYSLKLSGSSRRTI